MERDRRNLLIGAAASSLILVSAAACDDENDENVGAVEDLMREHGVIRRAILVYRSTAIRFRDGVDVNIEALKRTAKLLHDFGEDYHERQLEEQHIFPRLKKAGGPAAVYVDTLIQQHQRGRDITERVLAADAATDKQQLAQMLDAFELMYEHHASREDTIVFPAWKKTMSESGLREMGEKFEEIEHKQFGQDGFDMAVREIDGIERDLGLSDLGRFTPAG